MMYPFIVFLGLSWISARIVALAVGVALLVRWLVKLRDRSWRTLSPPLGVLVAVSSLIGMAAIFDDGRYVKMVPVVVNSGLFLVFARSLIRGPSMAELLARLHYPNLPAAHVPYCYRVTVVWTAFFAANGLLILWLAAAASLEAWTVYTGAIAYLLAGGLFAGERTYRAWRFRHYGDGPADAILRRIFPQSLDVQP
jgi:uncharacterized membrane protein